MDTQRSGVRRLATLRPDTGLTTTPTRVLVTALSAIGRVVVIVAKVYVWIRRWSCTVAVVVSSKRIRRVMVGRAEQRVDGVRLDALTMSSRDRFDAHGLLLRSHGVKMLCRVAVGCRRFRRRGYTAIWELRAQPRRCGAHARSVRVYKCRTNVFRVSFPCHRVWRMKSFTFHLNVAKMVALPSVIRARLTRPPVHRRPGAHRPIVACMRQLGSSPASLAAHIPIDCDATPLANANARSDDTMASQHTARAGGRGPPTRRPHRGCGGNKNPQATPAPLRERAPPSIWKIPN